MLPACESSGRLPSLPVPNYPNSERFMLMKSLAWFDHTEQEPAPLFLQGQTWPQIKARIIASLA